METAVVTKEVVMANTVAVTKELLVALPLAVIVEASAFRHAQCRLLCFMVFFER